MRKYIIVMAIDSNEDWFEPIHFAIETRLSAKEITKLIINKSAEVNALHAKSKTHYRDPTSNVIYLTPSVEKREFFDDKGNPNANFDDVATLTFEKGMVSVPVNMDIDELDVMTLDEWFEHCCWKTYE